MTPSLRHRAPACLAFTAVLVMTACSSGAGGGGPGRVAGGMAPGGAAPGGGRPGAGQPAPVVTALPKREAFGVVIEAVGTALARESVEITSKAANTVTAIRFVEGQRVARGAVLVEFDRAQAVAQLEEAEANLAESRNQYARGKDLSVTQALSRAQLDQLETSVKTAAARVAAARARLEDTVIRAPFAGRTGFRRVSVGGFVNPGTVITTLDDTSIIKLEFTVPQAYLADLAPGLPVTAGTEGMNGRTFTGRIATLGSRVDPVTRSIGVRAEIANEDGSLRPGMFMTVRLEGREAPALLLPEEALVPEQGRTWIYVVKDGRAQRREVVTGGRRPGIVAVQSGLADDERVVVEGTLRLREGMPVVEVPQGATPAQGEAPAQAAMPQQAAQAPPAPRARQP